MKVFEDKQYIQDIVYIASLPLSWEKLQGSSVMISGATGMIGSVLVDTIMYRNKTENMNCMVYALGRSEEKAKARFSYCWDEPELKFIPYDVNEPLVRDDIEKVGYVLHLASNTHPVAYATDPIGTITANIIGSRNMLEFASAHGAIRCAFASSNEIYGENRGDVELFDERYSGYIDCNTLRAGYPESKRCSEALCQAYIRQKGMDVVIARLTRSYGPTMLPSDTKAISQFIKNGVNGEDIVLKSAGLQNYSYTYVADAASGLLTVLLCGTCGEVYNVAHESSNITLRDLAEIIASYVGKQVVFQIPDAVESAGYSTATKALLDGSKLADLGWKPRYEIKEGITKTIDILKVI